MNHSNKQIPPNFDLYGHCMKKPLNKVLSVHTLLEKVPQLQRPYHIFILIRPRIIPIVAIVTFIIMQLSNLIGTYALIGNSQQETVRKFPSTFTPAGWAFSIWSLIFALQILLLIVQFIFGTILGRDNKVLFSKTGAWFALLHVWPSIWNLFWATEYFWVALFFIVGFLGNAALIYFLLNVRYDTAGQTQLVEMTGDTDQMIHGNSSTYNDVNGEIQDPMYEENENEDDGLTKGAQQEENKYTHLPTTHPSVEEQKERSAYGQIKRRITVWEFLVTFPVSSLLFGWLTVASLANVYVGMTASNIKYGDGVVVAGIVLAGFCAILMLMLRSDFIYASVIVWASFAISSRQKDSSEIVYTSALCNAVLVLSLVLVTIVRILIPYSLRKIVYFSNMYTKLMDRK